MERNWLIRTSQNQILGPVAKEKLLEFIQKGALGLMDEVTSGNGYWFALKEKQLVEKYLYGDVPQSYNPISEAHSVLSQRENPEKTTSINTAPANKTQVLKSNLNAGVTPANDDLEFPDITLIRSMPQLNLEEKKDDSKLPDSGDLEFPDMAKISSAVNESFKNITLEAAPPIKLAHDSKAIVLDFDQPLVTPSAPAPLEDVVLPAEDDLAFPDMNAAEKTSTKIEKGKVDLSHQYTRTVALDTVQVSSALPEKVAERSSNDFFDTGKDAPLTLKSASAASSSVKLDRVQPENSKLLYERKAKSAPKTAAALRDPSREKYQKEVVDGPVKKRNDNYIFFILIILILIIVAVFFYFKEILNKPLPV